MIFFFLALMSLSVEAATSGTSQPVGDYPRVATVDWTLVETLMSLGVVPVAAAQIKDYQAWVAEPALPESVVDIGLRGQPNRELAASLNLDLILISPLFSAIEPTLSQIAPVQTLTTYNPENDFWQNLVDTTRQVEKLTTQGYLVIVDKVRLLLLVLVAILTALATLIVGPLSFCGATSAPCRLNAGLF